MENLLKFPISTFVDKLVPKTAFYKHLEINTRLKTRFVEDVERIQWLYKLTPSTMNVDEGKAVHEIVMFLVTLKVEDTPDDVFLAIDRQMPRHVVFVLQGRPWIISTKRLPVRFPDLVRPMPPTRNRLWHCKMN